MPPVLTGKRRREAIQKPIIPPKPQDGFEGLFEQQSGGDLRYACVCVCVAKASCKQRIIYPSLSQLQIYSTPAAGLWLFGLNVNTLGKTVNPNKLAEVINYF